MDRRSLLRLLLTASGSVPGSESGRQAVNVYRVSDEEGAAELEWISSSAFRLALRREKGGASRRPVRSDKVAVTVRREGDWLEFATRYLRVVLEKRTAAVRVHDTEGKLLLADVQGPRKWEGRVIWERERQSTEKFWGLGPGAGLDGEEVEKRLIETGVPFLMSSLGYGEYFRPGGPYKYLFDERRRVEAPAGLDNGFYFYYGPTPKEILEEHVAVESAPGEIAWARFRLAHSPPAGTGPLPKAGADWQGLAGLVRLLLRSSYSAILFPGVDLGGWQRAERGLQKRARQLAVYLPIVYNSLPEEGAQAAEFERERARWVPFLVSYGYEAQERGFPLLRPLGMQYPRDPQAVGRRDTFMLGDELLVAPVMDEGRSRAVYLPAGEWTEWHTNARFRGRQVIEVAVASDWIPVFVKNGSVVPVAESPDTRRVAVHYFPSLAGEFFFYEDGNGALTQIHAAPAGELMRLEIEPAEERIWEWVVHHVKRPSRAWSGAKQLRPAKAGAVLRPEQWWHDERKGNLHLQVQPPAGTDHVIYVAF